MEVKVELAYLLRELDIPGLPRKWFTNGAAVDAVEAKEEETVAGKSNVLSKTSETSGGQALAEHAVASMGWKELKKVASSCQSCRLHEGRNNVVFGAGKETNPLIAFVGEGPGADEDKQGEPFVGRAGKLLTAAIENGIGLTRSEVYICNVVKCRPPGNRTPQPDETAACTPFLFRQLELLKPGVIVTLGQAAQIAMCGRKEGITKLRGKWLDWNGVPLMPTFHPAYLLRNPPMKKYFWEDLQAVMKKLGIEEKKSNAR